VGTIFFVGLLRTAVELAGLDLDAKVEGAERRDGVIPFCVFAVPDTVLPALLFTFGVVPVNLCPVTEAPLATAAVVVTTALVGRRLETAVDVPEREEDAVLVPAPDVAVVFVAVGPRETSLVAIIGRFERETVVLVVEGVTVWMAAVLVWINLVPGRLLGRMDFDGSAMRWNGLSSSVSANKSQG
jgi:hypothetical protein